MNILPFVWYYHGIRFCVRRDMYFQLFNIYFFRFVIDIFIETNMYNMNVVYSIGKHQWNSILKFYKNLLIQDEMFNVVDIVRIRF